MAAAQPDVTARVVAAWPALAFAVGIELLLQQRRAPVVEPVAAPVGAVDPPAAAEVPGRTSAPTPVLTAPVAPDTRTVGGPPAARPRVRDRAAAREKTPPGGRVLFADYLATARAAFTPGTTVTPAWVREVTGCSRGLSSRLAAALRAETTQAPPATTPVAYQPAPDPHHRTDPSTDHDTDQVRERAA